MRGFDDELSDMCFSLVRPGLFGAAVQRAIAFGVGIEEALFGLGALDETALYSAVARRLGLPFAVSGLRVRRGCNSGLAIRAGYAPLEDGGVYRAAVAPRGRALKRLLTLGSERALAACVVTTPNALSAAARAAESRGIAARAVRTRPREGPGQACDGAARWQGFAAALAAAFGPIMLVDFPSQSGVALRWALWALFATCGALRLSSMIALTRSANVAPERRMRRYPRYTVLVPLRGEAKVVGKLVAAIEALEYPPELLDVKILVERHDVETRSALSKNRLPTHFETFVVPDGFPMTKPRALDAALPYARGEFIVVYDAEDEPDAGQIVEAVATFERRRDLDCLQARLTIDNTADSWLSTLFTVEYAALFDAINPGLAALGAPIALGGTSNHFRTSFLRRIGAWDAWNVTEDAELGLWIARRGGKVGVMSSSTYEEAPAGMAAWFRQRRRWMKGWLQTLVAHTRQPLALWRDLGARKTAMAIGLVAGNVFGPMLGPSFLAVTIHDAIWGRLLSPATTAETLNSAAASVVFVAGTLGLAWPILFGIRRRPVGRLSWRMIAFPLYLALMSAAAWTALVDLLRDPYGWAKTEHGLARSSRRSAPFSARRSPDSADLI
ncbi:MAG: glycosyltransferase [Hyphomicrobiales bacterium]|nr:glycosyltransferase [Hyphomicrobiales bacterium]MDE2016709.1 glycosyltransferase [Hyphomicrobiales bacterium]